MLIKATIWDQGGVILCEQNCVYHGSCANHESAGDFRSESGFTPELTLVGDQVDCQTFDRPASSLSNGAYDYVPDNIDLLPQGCLYVKNGVIYRYDGAYGDDCEYARVGFIDESYVDGL